MKIDILKELLAYIFENKKWWVGSLLFMLVLLGFLLVVGESSPLMPLIYTIF